MAWGGSGRGAARPRRRGRPGATTGRSSAPAAPITPTRGRGWSACRRPGLELVVSPHKSVAELGVIGRAEDMHAIVDAERDATLDYLDRLVAERGGRRGRGQLRTPTGGLIWATSRHATTRAGDPQVHDHVLIANAVLMLDERGGWKGADTAFSATTCTRRPRSGRLAAARKAVELGYGIDADRGPRAASAAWPSPASRTRSARSTRSARRRSPRRSAPTPPMRRARSRPGPPGTARRMSPSATSSPAGRPTSSPPATRRRTSSPPSTPPAPPTGRVEVDLERPGRRAARSRRTARRREDLHPRPT